MERKYQVYKGNDLGAIWNPEQTKFRLWAPVADRVQLCLFSRGDGECLLETCDMERKEGGTWYLEKKGNLDGVYYTYLVTNGAVTRETGDPYALAAGVNGVRSMVVDLADTDPEGFQEEHGLRLLSPTDAVICEVSVADSTIDASSGVARKGKYLGLAERGTFFAGAASAGGACAGARTDEAVPTGLDYLASLGVTHLQLMPVYDFGSIDEANTILEQYNWGYDPVNYNVPEGSYSTDPFCGKARIRELKSLIRAIHAAGMGVIMDVVYNHTYNIEYSCFQKTAPDYFYRKTSRSSKCKTYANGSGCGNEIATEREMVRKYIIDSLVYWTTEYHIDGFRFDLMGVFDLKTMQKISDTLCGIRPDILLYGEGWTGGESPYPEAKRAVKANVSKLCGIGAFSNDIRDGVRGDVFCKSAPGFVNGKQGMENAIRYSVSGASRHPQVDYDAYTYTQGGPWARDPRNVINYISCHDNLTLWDKLTVTCPNATEKERLAMNRLGAAIVFTSQGIPFFLSGEEFGRTKPIEGSTELCENSYNSSKYTNSIRYDHAQKNLALIEYYRGLIAFRKAHRLLRLETAEEVRLHLHFWEELPPNVVAFTLTDGSEHMFVAYNADQKPVTLQLPEPGEYRVYITGERAGTEPLHALSNAVTVEPVSALVAVNGSSC